MRIPEPTANTTPILQVVLSWAMLKREEPWHELTLDTGMVEKDPTSFTRAREARYTSRRSSFHRNSLGERNRREELGKWRTRMVRDEA